jgi:uncharacterized protein YdhG (YjbR/CyaY superfamily)
MNVAGNTPDEYLENLPEDRKEVMSKLREVILTNLPDGFHEEMNYGMIGYVVPKSTYPAGYHCDPEVPLPFLAIANQKNFIAVYHMGIYADQKILDWFVNEYPSHVKGKLDMGKSCIRFKKMDQIPYNLLGELCQKIAVNDWINTYETLYKPSK